MTQFWFARRFPPGNPRNAFAPVTWQGYAATAVFVVVLAIGGLAFAWMGASGNLMQGAIVFAIASLVGGGWFITIANAKGDRTRTVADYRKAKTRV